VCSSDSRTMLSCLSVDRTIKIPAHIEVIGKEAFRLYSLPASRRAIGSRAIGQEEDEAFSRSRKLGAITIPSRVEILGDRCFEHCRYLSTVTVEELDVVLCTFLRKSVT
jgi:hypothetical protein